MKRNLFYSFIPFQVSRRYSINLKKGFLLICLILFAFDSHSGEVILIDSNAYYNITPEIRYLEDAEGTLMLHDILKKKDSFHHLDSNIKGKNKGFCWLKIELKNNSSNRNWYLQIDNPYISEVDVFEEKKDGSYKKNQVGTNFKFSSREVISNQIIIPLDIPKDTSRFLFVRIQSPEIFHLSLVVSTMKSLYEKNHPWDIINSMYFGLLIALMIYNLFVFISIKDKAYFYYVFYTLFMGLQVACFEGYGTEFLWPEIPSLNASDLYCAFSIIFFGFFTNSFLQSDKYFPLLNKLQWFLYGSTIITYLLWIDNFKLIMLFPFVAYVFIAGIVVGSKGFEPSKYYILGFTFLIAGICILLLRVYGFLLPNIFSLKAMQIGSSLEALVLSFALADKLHFYKEEKEKAQAFALDQTKQYSHQLIQSQEVEKKRIAAELHDSIGQSLIMIKNKALLLKNSNPASERIEKLTTTISDTIQEVRMISYKLRPFQLDLLGLTQSVKGLVEDLSEANEIDIKASYADIDGVFSKDDEINIYRIIQETLANVIEDSSAEKVFVHIDKKEFLISIVIKFQSKERSILNFPIHENDNFIVIRERLNILKGDILIDNKTSPDEILISITLPLN